MSDVINNRLPPPLGAPISTASGSPSTGSKLYVDQYNVIVDQKNLATLMDTPGADWHTVTQWQDQYDKELNQYKTDLASDVQSSLSSWTQANLDNGPIFNDMDNVVEKPKPDDLSPGIGADFHDQWTWCTNELKNLATTYKAPLFADQGTTAGIAPRADGGGFPGGQQGDAFQGQSVPKGYVSPPTIPQGTDLAEAYKNLTPAQAAYAGWALAQAKEQKQIYVPPEDAQAWNTMTTYASQHNAYIAQNSGNPAEGDTSVDAQVAAACQGNVHQNIGAIIGEAIGGVAGAVLGFLPGLEELGLFGTLAGTAARTGGEIGAAADAAFETAAGVAAGAATKSVGSGTDGTAAGLTLAQRLDPQGKLLADTSSTQVGATGGSNISAGATERTVS